MLADKSSDATASLTATMLAQPQLNDSDGSDSEDVDFVPGDDDDDEDDDGSDVDDDSDGADEEGEERGGDQERQDAGSHIGGVKEEKAAGDRSDMSPPLTVAAPMWPALLDERVYAGDHALTLAVCPPSVDIPGQKLSGIRRRKLIREAFLSSEWLGSRVPALESVGQCLRQEDKETPAALRDITAKRVQHMHDAKAQYDRLRQSLNDLPAPPAVLRGRRRRLQTFVYASAPAGDTNQSVPPAFPTAEEAIKLELTEPNGESDTLPSGRPRRQAAKRPRYISSPSPASSSSSSSSPSRSPTASAAPHKRKSGASSAPTVVDPLVADLQAALVTTFKTCVVNEIERQRRFSLSNRARHERRLKQIESDLNHGNVLSVLTAFAQSVHGKVKRANRNRTSIVGIKAEQMAASANAKRNGSDANGDASNKASAAADTPAAPAQVATIDLLDTLALAASSLEPAFSGTTATADVASTRFVQLGRVVLVTFGPDQGKIAVIAEIIDHNRVLIDGPTTGVKRQPINFARIALTPLVVTRLPRGAKSNTVKKMVEAQGIVDKWTASSWGKKLAVRARRAQLTDFDRFKVMVLKKRLRKVTATAVAAAKPKTAAQKKKIDALKAAKAKKRGASSKAPSSPSKARSSSPSKKSSPTKA
ncbi:hypothetical protein RI367_003193 [Sorochytrium milnesiophthora]